MALQTHTVNTAMRAAWNTFAQQIASLHNQLYRILAQEDKRLANIQSEKIRNTIKQ